MPLYKVTLAMNVGCYGCEDIEADNLVDLIDKAREALDHVDLDPDFSTGNDTRIAIATLDDEIVLEGERLEEPPAPTYHCRNCKSTAVQASQPAWFDPNNDWSFIEADCEADVLSFCPDCEEHDTIQKIADTAPNQPQEPPQ
jgi:hypothetical protein